MSKNQKINSLLPDNDTRAIEPKHLREAFKIALENLATIDYTYSGKVHEGNTYTKVQVNNFLNTKIDNPAHYYWEFNNEREKDVILDGFLVTKADDQVDTYAVSVQEFIKMVGTKINIPKLPTNIALIDKEREQGNTYTKEQANSLFVVKPMSQEIYFDDKPDMSSGQVLVSFDNIRYLAISVNDFLHEYVKKVDLKNIYTKEEVNTKLDTKANKPTRIPSALTDEHILASSTSMISNHQDVNYIVPNSYLLGFLGRNLKITNDAIGDDTFIKQVVAKPDGTLGIVNRTTGIQEGISDAVLVAVKQETNYIEVECRDDTFSRKNMSVIDATIVTSTKNFKAVEISVSNNKLVLRIPNHSKNLVNIDLYTFMFRNAKLYYRYFIKKEIPVIDDDLIISY